MITTGRDGAEGRVGRETAQDCRDRNGLGGGGAITQLSTTIASPAPDRSGWLQCAGMLVTKGQMGEMVGAGHRGRARAAHCPAGGGAVGLQRAILLISAGEPQVRSPVYPDALATRERPAPGLAPLRQPAPLLPDADHPKRRNSTGLPRCRLASPAQALSRRDECAGRQTAGRDWWIRSGRKPTLTGRSAEPPGLPSCCSLLEPQQVTPPAVVVAHEWSSTCRYLVEIGKVVAGDRITASHRQEEEHRE